MKTVETHIMPRLAPMGVGATTTEGSPQGREPGHPRPPITEAVEWVVAQDCTVGLRDLGDNTVSLVLTDPPYFIDGMGLDWDMRRLRRRTKPGVVGGIPAGQKFDPRQGEDLQAFLTPIATELMRVVKPGGFLLCFSQPRLAHRTAMALETAGFEIRDMLGWQFEGQAKAFSQDHFVKRMDLTDSEKETIIERLGGRKTPQLKPQMELIVLAQAPRVGTFVNNWLEYETGLIDVSDPILTPGSFPGTLIPSPKPKARFNHMTVKPVELCRHLIRIFSAPDSLVLDPFTGTGTTGVAALWEGRQFVGFEKDGQMARTANERIAGNL